jgi:hypothetical protein
VTNSKHHRNSSSPEPANAQELFDLFRIARAFGGPKTPMASSIVSVHHQMVSLTGMGRLGAIPIMEDNILIEIRKALQ